MLSRILQGLYTSKHDKSVVKTAIQATFVLFGRYKTPTEYFTTSGHNSSCVQQRISIKLEWITGDRRDPEDRFVVGTYIKYNINTISAKCKIGLRVQATNDTISGKKYILQKYYLHIFSFKKRIKKNIFFSLLLFSFLTLISVSTI